jgi:hypothetical protein
MKTTPKQVSDFAKDYQEMYIGFGQCISAYKIVVKQRNDLQVERDELRGEVSRLKSLLEQMAQLNLK